VWVNGRELLPAEKPRGARHVFTVPAGPGGLAAGANVLAVRVTLLPGAEAGREPLFQARLDVVRPAGADDAPGATPERPVTRKAAVCDLCAGREGGPACVRACAHDAAVRVDARAGLPG
jgi:hypothetical protein